jgi:hypothetical protein
MRGGRSSTALVTVVQESEELLLARVSAWLVVLQ